jgi:hypothetical protein
MFYKVVAEDTISRLTQLVEGLIHASWILAERIVFVGQNYPRQ